MLVQDIHGECVSQLPVALDLSKGIPCGVPLDLTVSCSAKRLSLHNKVRISLLVLLSSSI